jgi:iron complex outermembrane receptor protein
MNDLTDIERIEVLQGPQGTLYGKNTNAGAISVITKRPNLEEFEGYVEATVGDYSMGQLTAAASGPLGDNVAFRLSGSIHERDGYFDNAGADDLNDADDWNVQGKLLWTPTDSLIFLLSASHVDRDTNCCGADAIQDDIVLEEYANRGLPADNG